MEEEEEVQDKQDNQEDVIQEKQKLKTALHFFVGEIAAKHASTLDYGNGPMSIDKHAIAALAEITFDFAENLATDLQARIGEKIAVLTAASEERKAEKKRKKPPTTTPNEHEETTGKEEEEEIILKTGKGKKFFGGKS